MKGGLRRRRSVRNGAKKLQHRRGEDAHSGIGANAGVRGGAGTVALLLPHIEGRLESGLHRELVRRRRPHLVNAHDAIAVRRRSRVRRSCRRGGP